MSAEPAWAELRRLVIVANEPEAAIVCGLLDAAGIACTSRITDLAFGQGGELALAGGGPREVLVRADQLEAARRVLGDAQD